MIKLPKAPLHHFLENYVPPEVINKLTLTSQQKVNNGMYKLYTGVSQVFF